MSHAELTLLRMSTISAASAIATVRTSVSAASPRSMSTPAMSASDATVTPERNARAMGRARIHGTIWPSSATNTNDVPIFRYAEVLLNLAEAKAELGTITAADWTNPVSRVGPEGIASERHCNEQSSRICKTGRER